MRYQYEITKKEPIVINGKFGVYSFSAKLNKLKKSGMADSRIVQLKILCGGEVLVNYDYGWVSGHKFISLYQPLTEYLNDLNIK